MQGFSLIELSIVLLIGALLLAGLLVPLSAQVDIRRATETRERIKNINEAIVGFAIANGRLPCPAVLRTGGVESFCLEPFGGATCTPTTTVQPHGRCSNPFGGFVPAQSLGVGPTDDQGYALDGWGLTQNRMRYAVSQTTQTTAPVPGPTAMTTAGAFNTTVVSAKLSCDAFAALNHLYVCAKAPAGSPPHTNCGASTPLAQDAAFIVYSVGANAATGGSSPDEIENPNPNAVSLAYTDPVFVSHAPVTSDNVVQQFDDIVTWMGMSQLRAKLNVAGLCAP
jgi:prepilin-type N-terminal cleavage/methylation domain-containing protein